MRQVLDRDPYLDRQGEVNVAFEGGALAVDNDLRVVHGPAYYAP